MSIWINFWNQASIQRRVLLGASSLLLPLTVLFYFNVEQIAANIEFAQKEMKGSEVQRPLLKLLAQDPNMAAGSDLSSFSPQLDSVAQSLGLPSSLSTRLASLDSDRRKASPQGLEAWTRELRSAITKAGDGSNLTLDPDLDSYYLMDISSFVTAQSLDRLNTMKAFVSSRIGKRRLDEAERMQLSIYRAFADESDMQRIKGDLDTAMLENAKAARGPSPSLKPTLEPLAADYFTKQRSYLELLSKLVQGQSVSLAEMEAAELSARNSLMALAMAVTVELDKILEMRIAGYGSYRLKTIFGTLIALVLAVLLLVTIVSGIVRPLSDVVENLVQVSKKDLTGTLPESYLLRGDEVGKLAQASRAMSSSLNEVMADLRGSVVVLLDSASQLESSSKSMSLGVDSTSNRAQSTAVAAEQMSSNINSIAVAMEEASTNFSSVASASAQMTGTIAGIAASSEQARSTTSQASRQADFILEQMRQLSESANAIGQVTDTIKAISAQTNLLALNASIEAARAGVAGKGFAVVAGEIKELAQQTAAATEDIRSRIESVQIATRNGTEEISRVSDIVGGVSELVSGIAASIQEQSMTTQDISRNIAEAALGMQDANLRVSESSSVSLEIAKDAANVNQVAVELAAANLQVQSHADGLNAMARKLSHTIEQFSFRSN